MAGGSGEGAMAEERRPEEERRPQMEPSWLEQVGEEFQKPYMQELRAFLVEEKKKHRIFPPGPEIFNAFTLTPFDQVRVVILGQDPYHGAGQAHGLCFSVRRGVRPPPSLENIFQELHSDLQIPPPRHGDLSAWAQQGVLLLNTVLTVREREANSHKERGWESFTDRVISVLNERKRGLVFVLWGAHAGKKAPMIDGTKHLILRSAHPSPYSAANGFFGSRPFSKINDHLRRQRDTLIDWTLPE